MLFRTPCAEGSKPIPAEQGARGLTEVTYYVALRFVARDDGVAAGEPTECFNPNAAVMRAEALARKGGYIGAVAFSRTSDRATGEFSDANVIRKFGDVSARRPRTSMQPIVNHLNNIVRPSLRNFTAADRAFVVAQAAAAGVDEARQAVMLAARRPPSNFTTSRISS